MSAGVTQAEIALALEWTQFKRGIDQAKQALGNGFREMLKSTDGLKTALAGLATGLTLGAITAWMKSAIDAADATKEFGIKTGVAAKDVAGLQLAFQQGGVAGDALTSALGKMSKQMVDGNAAFDTLGVKTRAADGTLRNVKDVLYDAADAFAGITDGAAKSALAQEVFGKTGADLLPTLNDGADGLREMAAMAEKLGLVIDEDTAEAADKFNDATELLGMGLQGVARQTMAQLLPALNSVAGGMLEAMTNSEALRTASDALATGLKLLYSIFAVGIQVVSSFGQRVGATFAVIGALLKGEFKQADQIVEEFNAGIAKDWSDLSKNIVSVWDGTAAKTVEGGVKIIKAQRDIAAATKDTGDASKKAAAEEAKRAAEVGKLIGKIESATEVMQFELDTEGKLTAAQRDALGVLMQLRDGTIKATEAERIRLGQALEAKLAVERKTLAEQEEARWLNETAAANERVAAEVANETKAIRDQVAAQTDATASIGLTRDALFAHEQQVISDRIELLKRRAQVLEEIDPKVAAEYRAQAEELGKLKTARQGAFDAQAAQDAADAWRSTFADIAEGLYDSLTTSGKSAWVFLRDYIKNAVLRVTVLPMLQQGVGAVGGWLGSLLGIPGMSAGGGQMAAGGGLQGMGGLLNMAGMSGLGEVLGLAGGNFLAGAQATLSGAGLGSTLGSAWEIGGVSGASGALGAVAPYAAAAAAIYSLAKSLDSSGTPHVGGYALAGADGGVSDITAQQGGTQDAKVQSAVAQMARLSAALLNDTSKMFGGAGGFSVRSVFESDSNDPSWGLFHMLRNGGSSPNSMTAAGTLASDPAAGLAEFFSMAAGAVRSELQAMDLPQWASRMLAALGESPGLEALVQAAQAIAAQESALRSMAESVSDLGGPFAQLSQLSSDARMRIVDLAGGLQAFLSKTATYVDQYYSDGERMAIMARGVLQTLDAAGLDGRGATTRDQLRRAMDGMDASTALGQEQMAALLNVAGDYARVSEYMAQNNLTLGALAQMAPSMSALDAMMQTAADTDASAKETADNTGAMVEKTDEVAKGVDALRDSTDAQSDMLAEGFRSMIAQLTALNARMGAIERSVVHAEAAAS